MFRLIISGRATNRTPTIGGQTRHLRGGSTEILEDDEAALVQAWIAGCGSPGDYRLEDLTRPVRRVRMTEAQARAVLGSTRRVPMPALVARVEALGFAVPAARRTRNQLIDDLIEILRSPRAA